MSFPVNFEVHLVLDRCFAVVSMKKHLLRVYEHVAFKSLFLHYFLQNGQSISVLGESRTESVGIVQFTYQDFQDN